MEAVWQVLRMYDASGKLLSGIKSMYLNGLPCVNVSKEVRVSGSIVV